MNFEQKPSRRLSIPLSDNDLEDLEKMKSNPEILRALGVRSTSSASLVAALFEEGLRIFKDRASEPIYAQMKDEEDAERAARVARRNPKRTTPNA